MSIKNSIKVPVCAAVISPLDRKMVGDCLESGWVSSAGGFVNLFENNFRQYLDVHFAVTASSGTAALHLALASLGVGQEDEVIMPDLTAISDAFAAMYLGAKPVLVDVDIKSGNIDHTLIEKKISKKTKAIIVVHLFGRPANMDPILKIARKHKIYVVEDAAEALGVSYRNRLVGGRGTIGIFSFYGNKIMTTGEGGMLVTNDRYIFEKVKILKDLSHRPGRRFHHDYMGFNYRMSSLQAALGVSQLKQLNAKIRKKQHISKLYTQLLREVPFLEIPPKDVCWMFDLLVSPDAPFKREELLEYLKGQGIDTRTYFYPLHKQKALGIYNYKNDQFPAANSLSERGFYLPSGLDITDEQMKWVSKEIRNYITQR